MSTDSPLDSVASKTALAGGIEEAKERPVELKSKKPIRLAGLRIADSSVVSEGDYSD